MTPILFKLPVLALAAALSAQGTLRGTQPVPQQRPFLRRDTASRILYAKILEAEDKRTITQPLLEMLGRPHVGVRRRAAMAVGRIGDPAGVAPLLDRLDPGPSDGEKIAEPNLDVRKAVVFALGELEDARATGVLLGLLQDPKTPPALRARAAEALGKIGSNASSAKALGNAKVQEIAAAIAAAIPSPDRSVLGDDLMLGSLGTTALLRLKQPSTLPTLVGLLSGKTQPLRWQAANAISRMRPDPAAAAKAVDPLLAMLKSDDPLDRAQGARALGVVKAKAVDALVPLLGDKDQRVQVSAVRALGALGEAKAAAPLDALGERLLASYRDYVAAKDPGVPDSHNLLMAVAEALGALKSPSSLPLLQRMRALDGRAGANPETELAVAAYGEQAFFDVPEAVAVSAEWHHEANYAQGLGVVGGERAKRELLDMLAGKRFGALDPRAVPDLLTSLDKLKVEGLEAIEIEQLSAQDVVVRATAAQLLADRFAPTQSELTFKAFDAALKAAAPDAQNDAKLAILDGIAKYNRTRATDLLSSALLDPDYVVRRKAAELLEAAGTGKFLAKVGPATTPVRPRLYYERVEAMMRRPNPRAVISTEKGDIRIELLVRDAPMTVDNFMELARKKFFDGTVFHRVVPNFVVQGGDPRGDGNGGPGYQIRCEVNEVPYDRGAVGMALSGKDTGGSQFFITHSPQPHLDGGYTVFARVTDGMDVVDRLARGDKILSVTILE